MGPVAQNGFDNSSATILNEAGNDEDHTIKFYEIIPSTVPEEPYERKNLHEDLSHMFLFIGQNMSDANNDKASDEIIRNLNIINKFYSTFQTMESTRGHSRKQYELLIDWKH